MHRMLATGARCAAAAVCVSLLHAAAFAAPAKMVPPVLSPERRAQEAAFMRAVRPNETANDLTSNVLAHTGEHVAFTCEISELTRPGVVVGQCGPDDEPVDLYIKMLPGTWRIGEHVRVLGIMDTPGSWSDVSGHTIYYPFIKAIFIDRLKGVER